MSLLDQLNQQFFELFGSKENAFWSTKMGLADARDGEFEHREIQLKQFTSDASLLPTLREELQRSDLDDEERVGLEGWVRFFEVNAIESPEALQLQDDIIEREAALERARRDMALGYRDPATGELTRASSVELGLMVSNAVEEDNRRAAWEGLRSIEDYVLANGFLELVRERNALGRMLGYEDYYDYKVSINEGFSKAKLFSLLDELEVDTRDAARRSVEDVVDRLGQTAAKPWNFLYLTTGDTTALTDPYHRFDTSVDRWGRLFSAMGVRYEGASLTLDLIDRAGKYENGFMHGPSPAMYRSGRFQPARINFTANAAPGRVGSGQSATKTLLHEGGHAAHFSNIKMPAPCFSQEFAPTSVAFAETQSMFFDSLMGDADWMTRYARNANGESMPIELIEKVSEQNHRYRAHQIRRMLSVSYAEKALYEMSESELTPTNVLSMLRDVEQRMLFQPASGRPVLSVPHLLAGESSAYYHGYILAQMAVYQTRDYFLCRHGYLMDNPAIGPELQEKYWRPGNSRTFLQMIEDLTGEPFSARATVALVNKSLEEVFSEAREAVKREAQIPKLESHVALDATIRVVNGDELIASTEDGGFEGMSSAFAGWIRTMEPS